MAIATLTVDLVAKLATLERDLGKATHMFDQAAQKWSSALGTIGASISVGAVSAAIKGVIDDADQLAKASQKYGIAVEELSALAYAGKLADVSFEALGTGIKKLSVNMADTAAGTGEAKDAFKALGISVKDADGNLKSSDQVMNELADRFSRIEDGAGKTALAVKIFGKAGADMIPLLNAGSRGIAEMKEEAERLGVIIGGDLAKKSEEFNDNLTRMGAALDAVKIALAGGVIDDLVKFTDAQVEAIKIAGGFGESLRLFVFNLDAMTTEKPAEELRRLTKALEEYQAAGNFGKFAQSPTGYMFGGREEDLKKQIEFLKYLQRQEALAITAGMRGRLDARDLGPEPRETAPTVPDDQKKKKDKADPYAGLAGYDDNRSARDIMAELHAEDQALESMRQKYVDMADPLQKYRVQLDEINKLRADGTLTANQAIEAEWRVNEAMDSTMDKMDGLKEKGTDVFAELGQMIDGWGKQTSGAIADFVIEGKGSFKDLAKSFIKELTTMVIYQNTMKPLATGISKWISGLGTTANADGGVYTSASLSKYSGGVYDSPRLFAFANGAGVFAEAGPEAIMPLKRGADGKLGVQSSGGGGDQYNISISVSSDGRSSREGDAGKGAQLGRQLEAAVMSVIVREKRPGGQLAKAA